jgi:ABC-type transporter Mla subunit MlaD
MIRDEDQKYDGALGIFTAVAIILLVWGFCWLKSYNPFFTQQHIKILFPEVAGLNPNADVYAGGVKVGCVAKINWLEPTKVLVCLRLTKPNMVVREGSRFDILTNGLIGAKYIDITLAESAEARPLDDSIVVAGEKPVLAERVVNKFARELDKIDMDNLSQNLDYDRKVLEKAADKFTVLADKTMPVMDRAVPLESEISRLSVNLRRTSTNLNRLLDSEHISPELRETVKQANETARDARAAIHELNVTLSDREMRGDLVGTMKQFSEAAGDLQSSMRMLKDLSTDKDLRADTKQMLLNARIAMEKLDEVFSDPNFGSDLRATMQKTRAAVQDIDIAAQQLRQILNKRQPLLHMIFGRPGYIKLGETEIHPELPAESVPSKTVKRKLLHIPFRKLQRDDVPGASDNKGVDYDMPLPVLPELE